VVGGGGLFHVDIPFTFRKFSYIDINPKNSKTVPVLVPVFFLISVPVPVPGQINLSQIDINNHSSN
jgi:hypothetical protein